MDTCRKAYNDGSIIRAKTPLKSGHYKLRDTLRTLKRCKSTIGEIGAHLHDTNTRGDKLLGCCMSYEKHTWLKQLPIDISTMLGQHVMPGIIALSGDGVPAQILVDIMNEMKPRIDQLKEECERQRQSLRHGIQDEYRAIKAGSSGSMDIVDEAIAIITDCLEQAGLPV